VAPPSTCRLALDVVASLAVYGAFYTLVPIRPRSRGGRRSLRTFAGASLRPPHGFNPRPRRLSTPTDAFQLHPDIRSYGTTLRRALLRDAPRDASTPGDVSTRARQGTKYIYSPSRALVPTRPRSRGSRRSSRILRFGFDPDTPRRLSTPPLTPFDSAPPRPRRPRRARSTTPTPTSARATSFG
jgi:hypothetical protein